MNRIYIRQALKIAANFFMVAVGVLSLAGSAQALLVHKYLSSFGTTGPGKLREPIGVAVNDSTGLELAAGDVYVADAANNRVERFSGSGEFLGWFNGSGEYDVEGAIHTGMAAPTGALTQPQMIAVDDSGSEFDPSRADVYVVDKGTGAIDKFSPLGEYLGQIVDARYLKGKNWQEVQAGESPREITETEACVGSFQSGEGQPCSIVGLAIDPAGTLWVAARKGPIYSFSNALGNVEESERITPFGGGPKSLAVDGEDNLYFETESYHFVKVAATGERDIQPFGGLGREIVVDANHREAYIDHENALEAVDLLGNPIESERAGGLAPSFGVGHISVSAGLGVNDATGTVYASDVATDSVSIFEAITLPSVALGLPSARGTHGAMLNGTVNPEGRPVTSCVFEYDTRPYVQGEAAHGIGVPCTPASLGSGTSPVAVSAQLAGLTPQIAYYYRLVAGNTGGRIPSSDRELFTGPRLGHEWSTEVSSSSVTLQAELGSDGADTHYYFEYGVGGAYEADVPAAPGADLGAGEGTQTVSVHLQGLQSGAAVYHYRLVAAQDGEEFFGKDQTVTTEHRVATGLTGLIDGRAWELVSPPNKRGALIELEEQGGAVQAAADGSGISYITKGASLSPSAHGKQTFSQALSRRKSGEWSTEDVTLPQLLPENGEGTGKLQSSTFEYRLFSPDLNLAAVQPELAGTPPLASGVSESTLYLRDDDTGGFVPLVSSANVPAGTKIDLDPNADEYWEMKFLGATPDLKNVVLETPAALTENAIDEESPGSGVHEAVEEYVQWNLYEWSEGALRLVNVLPGNGGVAHGRYTKGVPPVLLAGLLKGTNNTIAGGAQRAISGDGQRVAWTWGAPAPTEASAKPFRGLFVRDMAEERTVRVGGADAAYQTMNSEGTKIFYLEGGELYEYEWEIGAEAGVSINLTAQHENGEASAEVQAEVSDVSEDGSYVYLVAKGVLAAGGKRGEDNLYVLHEVGGVWTTKFIASLQSTDNPDWEDLETAQLLARVSSRVSPDGRFLAFMSSRSLTGYDNTDLNSGAADEEVYLYDAQTERLACASCDPTGARPAGILDSKSTLPQVDRAGVWADVGINEEAKRVAHWLAGNLPGWDHADSFSVYQPRYLSDSGRLFFDSPVGLVPGDTNSLEDVYEFEPEGVGGCTSTTFSATQVYVGEEAGRPVGGCVGLISSGSSGTESAFYDASEDGDDVFFSTTAKLVGADFDTGYDLYDAHVCTTAVPCANAIESPPPCASGEACRTAPAAQPAIFGAPPSATFEGIGNLGSQPAVSPPHRGATADKRALAHALKACHTKRSHGRLVCERRARRRYAAVKGSVGAAKVEGRRR